MDALTQGITKLEIFSERVCLNFQGIDVGELGALEKRLVRVVSNLRVVLNGTWPPVNKLPPELLSQIFTYLHTPGIPSRRYPLEPILETSNTSLAAVNLVCRFWRQAAIGARELVTDIATITVPDFGCRSRRYGKGPRAGRRKQAYSSDPNRELDKWSKVAVSDFVMMRVLGKGRAGKTSLVRHKPSSGLFALKTITKRHVLANQELQQILTEQAVLKRMATEGKNPFVVKLWWSFHDPERLFLVMDFHPGGDLATQLARWGRLGRDRARFYATEIVEGIEGLHKNRIIYRDLKPENVLIGSDGHIVLTSFGLSKEFPRRSNTITAPPDEIPGAGTETTGTFCGTAGYLAPEVIQGLPYSFEVDWWSFGTMLYEMLVGVTPFWANNHSDMHVRVLQDEPQFPRGHSMDQDAKSLIRGLLQKNPALRIKEPSIKRHPYFSMINWSHVYYKRCIPPYIPQIDPTDASDARPSDKTFLATGPVVKNGVDGKEQTDTDQDRHTDTDGREGEDSVAAPSRSHSPSVRVQESELDVFDGYWFKGHHSVITDDSEENSCFGDDEDEGEDEAEGASVSESLISENIKVKESTPTDAAGQATETGPEGDEPRTPEAQPITLPAEVPTEETKPGADSIFDSQRGETSSRAEKPFIPPKPSTAPGSAKQAAKRREKSGIAALDKRLGDDTNEPLSPEEMNGSDLASAGVDVGKKWNESKGTSPFARGDRNRFAVSRKLKSRHRGSLTVLGVSDASDTETVPPSPSEEQSPRPLFPLIRRNVPRTPPTSSPLLAGATSKQHVVAHSSSTGWRERYNVRFTDKTPDSTRGPRRTKPRPRARGPRNGSISGGYFSDSSHLSEGHQSPEEEEESKKKVDWYDEWYARRGDAGDV